MRPPRSCHDCQVVGKSLSRTSEFSSGRTCFRSNGFAVYQAHFLFFRGFRLAYFDAKQTHHGHASSVDSLNFGSIVSSPNFLTARRSS